MSKFPSKLKARLKFSQQIGPNLRKDTGWVRAALQCIGKGEEVQENLDFTEKGLQKSTFWEKDLIDRMKVVNLASQENVLSASSQGFTNSDAELSSECASQMFWETGSLDCKLLDGFYSVAPSIMLKQRFKKIPTIEQLKELALDTELDVLLIDSGQDKVLASLKEFTFALLSDTKASPIQLVKDIAEVVADFYGGPLLETGSFTGSVSEAAQVTENDDVVRLLGEIKIGLCHPRAILFKYLGDALGLHTRIMTGLQLEAVSDVFVIFSNSNKHFSNIVDLNDMEFLVDVMGYPGHLRPLSAKSLISYHTSAPGDSDSTDNNSCDSPLEPNSPSYGNMESPSHSDQDLTGSCLQLRHKKALSADYGIPSSSPEYPLFKARAPSKLSGSRQHMGDDVNETRLSSSDNSPQHQKLTGKNSPLLLRRRTSSSFKSGESGRISHSLSCDVRRARKRSTPEISDDIVRVVRAMNQAMKHSQSETRLTEDREKNSLCELTEIMEERPLQNINKESPDVRWSPSLDDDTTISSGSWENTNFEIFSENTSQPHFEQIDLPPKVAAISNPNNSFTWKDTLSFSDVLQRHTLLPYAEWNIDFSELRIGIRVGIGSFGEVFRGVWRGTEVAIKVMLEQDVTKENTDYFCNEISLLSRLRHPNVILFLGACTKPPHLSTVTEYMHMGSLYNLVHLSGQGKKLSWRRRLKMLRDICRGMMCVQRMEIIHRDLKSANCLVDKHWTVKVCDFGLSRITNGTPIQESTAAGTPEWMAPELLRKEPVTYKCDIFSFGVIMWELCTLNRPWDGVQPTQVVNAVARDKARLEIPDGLLGSLIADCWAEVPAARPSYDEILSRLHECEFLQS